MRARASAEMAFGRPRAGSVRSVRSSLTDLQQTPSFIVSRREVELCIPTPPPPSSSLALLPLTSPHSARAPSPPQPPPMQAPLISLPSLPPTSFSQFLVRRRSSRRQLAHTPSTKTSSSVESVGTVFRRALAAVEEVGREKRVVEWRKREVGERAVESWREEVADEVALQMEREREKEGGEVVAELKRMMEGSEGELLISQCGVRAPS